jgi:hypothetical protein
LQRANVTALHASQNADEGDVHPTFGEIEQMRMENRTNYNLAKQFFYILFFDLYVSALADCDDS